MSSNLSLIAGSAFCYCDKTPGTCNFKKVYLCSRLQSLYHGPLAQMLGLVLAQCIIAGVWQRRPIHLMTAGSMIIQGPHTPSKAHPGDLTAVP